MARHETARSTVRPEISPSRAAEPPLPLTAFGPARVVRPKTILCSQGDRIESLYLIEAGAVKLMREGFRGRRMLTAETAVPAERAETAARAGKAAKVDRG